jgi:GNAT superfamily N-acetyltransferase
MRGDMTMVEMQMATKNDVDSLFGFFKELTLFHLEGFDGILTVKPYEESRTIAKIEDLLSDKSSGIIIGKQKDEIVAVLGYFIKEYGELSNFDYNRYILIDRVIVKKDLRGGNIGQEMIEEVERLAISQGIKRVELELAIFNRDAERFYERLGFNCYMKIFAKDL